MSAQLLGEIMRIKDAIADLNRALVTLRDELQMARDATFKLEADRKENRKAIDDMSSKVAELYAMRTVIFEEARKNGMTRDPIDPTKVKMPAVLKSMGYKP